VDSYQKLKEKLTAPKKPDHLPFDKGLSSGSTLINLAATGRPEIAMLPGTYALWVGDPGSGKTFLTLTTLAEAAINPVFDDYRLIYHNAENGALMDLERFFGKKMASRLEPPAGTKKAPQHTNILEEFYEQLGEAVSKGPCVYLLDSMDSLMPRSQLKQESKDKKAAAKGLEVSGSFGTDKAKINSTKLRPIANKIKKNGSILIIISQTRNRIGFGSQYDPKTRGGGDALTFYSHLELWTSVRQHLSKKVGKKSVEQGVVCRVKVKRSRFHGRQRTVDIPIIHSAGMDDLGGLVNWMVEWEQWSGKENTVTAPEFDFSGNREKLIQKIEEEGREKELREIVVAAWDAIEKKCEVRRKNKYSG
jgi:RecA/RadA recombinase